MGLFSGVSKAVSSVTNSAKGLFDSAKGVLNDNPLLKTAGTAALDYYLPGAGTVLGSVLGGDYTQAGKDLGSMFSSYGVARQNAADMDKYYAQQKSLVDSQNQNAYRIAQEANQQSQMNAREQMGFQYRSNQDQMWFQERMANSAHQREVQDLRAAGLNPILSGTGGMGSATPAGSSSGGAQGSVTAAPVASALPALTSAADIVRSLADTTNKQASTKYLETAQTELTKAQAAGATQGVQESKSRMTVQMEDAALKSAQQSEIGQRVHNMQKQYEVMEETIRNMRITGKYTAAQIDQVKSATFKLISEGKSLAMKASIDTSEFGKYVEMARRVTDVAGLDTVLNAFKWVKQLRTKPEDKGDLGYEETKETYRDNDGSTYQRTKRSPTRHR